jgi:hypothetical protein
MNDIITALPRKKAILLAADAKKLNLLNWHLLNSE